MYFRCTVSLKTGAQASVLLIGHTNPRAPWPRKLATNGTLAFSKIGFDTFWHYSSFLPFLNLAATHDIKDSWGQLETNW